MTPKYPIYVISKGRFENCLTAKFFVEDGTPFHLVVEPQEYDEYASRFGAENVYELPFSNLGLGSIPARNWVWEHAKAAGHEKHWIFDDNIRGVFRRFKGIRLRCNSGPAICALEEFADRYENLAIAGMNYTMFIPDGQYQPVFVRNVHVYSCLLILNSLPNRWRGRYNEDTDLCLQVLSGGWCTVLFNVFAICKMPTMVCKGGNTTELYKADGRLEMAKSLERLWPGVVQVRRRFKRPQHVINWRRFQTPLKRKPEVNLEGLQQNEFGLVMKTAESGVESPLLQKMVADYAKETQNQTDAG